MYLLVGSFDLNPLYASPNAAISPISAIKCSEEQKQWLVDNAGDTKLDVSTWTYADGKLTKPA